MKHLKKFNEMEQWQKNLRDHIPELDNITFHFKKSGKEVTLVVRRVIEDRLSRGVYKLEDGKVLEWDFEQPEDQIFNDSEFIYNNNVMNENQMELNIHGLKCDSCDWEDMTIPVEDYEKHVNAECPKCGENILTEDDYQQVLQMQQAVAMLKGMSQEDINKMVDNLSPEEMDQALDQMNDLGMKKTGDNEDGTENWTMK